MMDINRILELRDKISELYSQASSSEDGVEDLCINGEGGVELLQLAADVVLWAKRLSAHTSMRLEIDEEVTDVDDLEPFLTGFYKFSKWRLNIRKIVLSRDLKAEESDPAILFFFDQNVFKDWLDALNPLKSDHDIFVQNESVLIFLAGLDASFGGPRLAVLPLESSEDIGSRWPMKDDLPSEETLREHVHLVPSEPIRLSPRSFALTWGDFGSYFASPFRRMSAICVAAGFADVIYSQEKVVVKGVRHLEIPLFNQAEKAPSEDTLALMQSALSWVYEERVDTRKRLLSDRLCLESDNESSFIGLLTQHLDDSFKQSKDQYRFVILDRKDEYATELRSLLKDLREQADLYAEKVRGLIGGLLRDTLAAFVFVALSLSSRLGSKVEVLMSEAGVLFFKALAVYFLISAFFQGTSAFRDIVLSDRELQKWSEVTREYFSRKELNERISKDLRGRRITFYIYMGMVSALYLVMAGISWNMQEFSQIYINVKSVSS